MGAPERSIAIISEGSVERCVHISFHPSYDPPSVASRSNEGNTSLHESFSVKFITFLIRTVLHLTSFSVIDIQ